MIVARLRLCRIAALLSLKRRCDNTRQADYCPLSVRDIGTHAFEM